MGDPTLLFYMDVIRKKIAELAESIASEQDVQFVDVELAGSMRKTIVKVFIDKKGGVTLDDCEKFSKALSMVLDVEDLIQNSYVLEVSSPGLDRPLRGARDFERNIGRIVKITLTENIDDQEFYAGLLKAVSPHNITLSLNGGQVIDVPFERILKAKLEIEFK